MYAENELQYALNIAEDGRILSATFPQYASADAKMVVGLPEGNITEYIYHDVIEDGEIIGYYYDYVPIPEEDTETEENTEDLVLEILADHELRLCEIELFG